jgi:NDP-sugar pyrophosphorylase family protein
MPKDINIAILAKGLAARLGELTRNRPKYQLKIQGRTFIEFQTEQLQRQGITDILISTGQLGGSIEFHLGNGRRPGLNGKDSGGGKTPGNMAVACPGQ